MPGIIVKYKNTKTPKALKALSKYFEFVVAQLKPKKKLSIVFAEKPDVTALAGIWKDRDISLEDIRVIKS